MANRYWMTPISILIAVLVSVLGCTSLSESVRNAGKGLDEATAPVRDSWRRVNETKPEMQVTQWKWMAGIPVDAPRGELLSAVVDGNTVAQLVPDLGQSDVRLVSTAPPIAGYEIRNVGGYPVSNCGELHTAIESLVDTVLDVQVDLARVGEPSENEIAIKLDRSALMTLGHGTASQTGAFRVADGGHQTFVIRDGGIRGQALVRVERNLGLVQVVLTIMNCWEQERLLPVEVAASTNGTPLKCLTVADTLEVLYGDPESYQANNDPSFAQTSEREDYLLPVNYQRLAETFESRGLITPTPALASLMGAHYPGDALLGDARALTGIMLQRQLLKRGQRAPTGWVIFAGDEARAAEFIDVSIDLGGGPSSYRFMIPSAS